MWKQGKVLITGLAALVLSAAPAVPQSASKPSEAYVQISDTRIPTKEFDALLEILGHNQHIFPDVYREHFRRVLSEEYTDGRITYGNEHITYVEIRGEHVVALQAPLYDPLPPSIGALTYLEDLNLRENYLTALPESIGYLTNLKFLDLVGNNLTRLPASIGRLANLQHLDVYNNALTALPETVGELSRLTLLGARGNRLSALPDSIGRLKNLQHLDIGANQLTALPESIGELKHLDSLYADHNRLTVLPASLENLGQLRVLHLMHNSLTALPVSVASLRRLEIFHIVEGNPLLNACPLMGQLEQRGVFGDYLSTYYSVGPGGCNEPKGVH